MAMSSPGIGSGLNVNGIVSQLMAAEQKPLERLVAQQSTVQTQISAYGMLRSAIDGFQTAMGRLGTLDKFKAYATTSSNDKVLTASASADAARGVYSLDVERIAESHRMASANTFIDSDSTRIGTAGDTMSITVGNAAFTINYGDKTLAAIRDAINDAADNQGVTATIVKDDAGYRLLLNADDTGSAHALSVATSGADPFGLQTLNADRDASGGFTAADLDAVIKFAGTYTATRSSNTVSDLLQGVTLTLASAGSANLTVDRDTGQVKSAVGQLVQAYNSVMTTMNQLRSSALRDDRATLVSIESQFRGVMNTPAMVGGSFELLYHIGIATKKDGTLELKDSVLDKALTTDFDGVARLFADPAQGFAVRMKSLADSFLGNGGFLGSRTESLNRQLRDLGDRQNAMGVRLLSVQQRLQRQFSSLDGLMASLHQTSQFLSQQLGSLPAASGK